MRISIFGLGKLGSPLAAVLADKGHEVVGVDINPSAVDAINAGKAPVFEPGLQELIDANRERLRATTDGKQAVLDTDITFILTATPSDESGGFSLRYVLPAAETIGSAIREKSGYHLVVLTSTVMPGATATQLLPALEAASRKRCGTHFGLCYNPEFIALGTVIRDLLNPDFILLGESDQRAGDVLSGIYTTLCDRVVPVARMNFVNAEITKLAVNTYVTTRISYANMLADVCERLPGADVDAVTGALGLDSRIGKKYLKGAVSYGGPCFPRDNRAFSALASQLGTRALLAEATDSVNHQRVESLTDMVCRKLSPGGTAGVLGLSYKPNTDVIENAAGLLLALRLMERGMRVLVYDPVAMPAARRRMGDTVEYASSASEVAKRSSVIVLATAWDEFKKLAPEDLFRGNKRATVIDPWRALDRARFEGVADFVTLGSGPVPAGIEEAKRQVA